MKTSTSYHDAAAIRKKNLENILRGMNEYGVQSILADFDSERPSTIDAIRLDGNTASTIPAIAVHYTPLTVDHIHDGSVLVKYHEQPNTLTLREAIEAWCMQLLEDRHRGWHKGAGCYGTFTFSEPDECVTLDINQRIVRSKTEIYEP